MRLAQNTSSAVPHEAVLAEITAMRKSDRSTRPVSYTHLDVYKRQGFDLQEVERRGLDIVVAIDTSKSMLATDIAPNRLERAKPVSYTHLAR